MAQPLRIKTDTDERIYNTEAYFMASPIIWTPSQTLIPIDGSDAGKRKVGNNVDTYADLDFENSGAVGSYSPPIPQSDVTDLESDLSDIVAQAARDRHPVVTFSTNTNTAQDPGQATIRFNNGTIASVTEIALSDADSEGIDKGDLNSRCAGIIQLRTVASAATIEFLITAVVHTSWTRYTVTYLKGSLPANGTAMTYRFLPTNAATPAVTTALAAKANAYLVGNTLFVNKDGDDATGLRERPDKAFQTITAAKTAATTGDTIIVSPGTYNEYDLAKNGINYYFNAGAKVVYTGTPVGGREAIFRAAEAEGISAFGVYGNGHFEWAAGGSGYVAYWQDSDTVVRIHADKVVSDGSGLLGADTGINVDIFMQANEGVSTNDAFYTSLGGDGLITLQIDQVTAGASLIIAEGSGGTVNIVFSRANCLRMGTVSAGDVIIDGRNVEYTSSGYGLSHQGSTCRVVNTRIKATNASSIPIELQSVGLVLDNCQLVAGGSATVSIDAASALEVVSYGSYANVAKDSDVTINGLLTVGAYVV